MNNFRPRNPAEPTLALIVAETARSYGIGIDVMRGDSLQTTVVRARQLAIHVARELTTRSPGDIGKAVRRDYSTVMRGIARIEELLAEDEGLCERRAGIVAAILAHPASPPAVVPADLIVPPRRDAPPPMRPSMPGASGQDDPDAFALYGRGGRLPRGTLEAQEAGFRRAMLAAGHLPSAGPAARPPAPAPAGSDSRRAHL